MARRRPGRIFGAAAGIALAIALLGSLGSFVASAKSQMTLHAIEQVGIDWQVEIQKGSAPASVLDALRSRGDVVVARVATFGQTTGFRSGTGDTTQETGPGLVLGIPGDYRRTFPSTIRTLVGSDRGVLIAQQTAANLHASPGTTIAIGRAGLDPVSVTVDGVVELPDADSLFQKVGAPPGAQPSAPPDNVLLLPIEEWHRVFDPLASLGQDLTREQVHARLDHHLPADPASAFSRVSGAGRRFESDLAGGALVGNNLAATLGAARADAAYAQVLFILLGAPGVAIAALLVRSVVVSSRDRRRRDFAILRLRGASRTQLHRLALAESLLAAAVGAIVGVAIAVIAGRAAFSEGPSLLWAAASVGVGALIAIGAIAVPAWRDATTDSVVSARRVVGRPGTPLLFRYGIDVVIVGAAGLVFWATSRSNYQLVLAPEGVPTVSVSYWALAGPLLLWVGAGLVAWRVADFGLRRQGRAGRRLLRMLAGSLTGPVSSTLKRQRRSLASSIVLLTLTVAFAISVSIFNATYLQQVDIDALLTNGAPVTVTEPPGAVVPEGRAASLANVPGAGHVEAMQHRVVYVGADLQDLYGVDATSIGAAGKLQDAYFGGASARETLGRLAAQPEAALVSDETVKDFQLKLGDRLNLRVRDARTGNLKDVGFRFAGIVKEFPTAPTDSFVVANSSYVAAQTGDDQPGTFLVDTAGVAPRTLAGRVRSVVGATASVTNIDDGRRVIGSSLTAVDLAGLTRLELGYALFLALAAGGLELGLGLAQRRRSAAIITALGARPPQLGAFVRAQGAVLALFSGLLGAVGGWVLTLMLTKVLTGVFDPPPARLAVPWTYLAVFASVALAGLVAAGELALRAGRRPLAEELRDL